MGGRCTTILGYACCIALFGGCDALQRWQEVAHDAPVASSSASKPISAPPIASAGVSRGGRVIPGLGLVPYWSREVEQPGACQARDAERIVALSRGEHTALSAGTADVDELVRELAGECVSAAHELATALNTGGYKLYKGKRYAEAIHWWHAGLTVRPSSILLRYNLACGLVLTGKLDDGVWMLQELSHAARDGDARAARQLKYAETDNDLRAVRDLPGFRQAVAVAEPPLKPGKVGDAYTPDGVHFVQGFKYQLRGAAADGEAFLDARDNCHAIELDLCSEEQWQIICSSAPQVAARETWTTSYTPTGNLVTRGGSGCSSAGQAPPEERSAGRLGLCCERRVGIDLVEKRGKALAESAQTYMGMAENAMNSRNVQQTLRLLGEDAFLYNRNSLKDRTQLQTELAFDVKNSTEFSNRLVRCKARIFNDGQAGEFACDTVSTRKLVTRRTRELAMFTSSFRFAPPMLKYREWAVGTNFARGYKAVQ